MRLQEPGSIRREGMGVTDASSDRQDVHWEFIDAENDEEFSLRSHSELPRVQLLSFAPMAGPCAAGVGKRLEEVPS